MTEQLTETWLWVRAECFHLLEWKCEVLGVSGDSKRWTSWLVAETCGRWAMSRSKRFTLPRKVLNLVHVYLPWYNFSMALTALQVAFLYNKKCGSALIGVWIWHWRLLNYKSLSYQSGRHIKLKPMQPTINPIFVKVMIFSFLLHRLRELLILFVYFAGCGVLCCWIAKCTTEKCI